MKHGRDHAGGAVGGSGDDPAKRGVFFVDRERRNSHPLRISRNSPPRERIAAVQSSDTGKPGSPSSVAVSWGAPANHARPPGRMPPCGSQEKRTAAWLPRSIAGPGGWRRECARPIRCGEDDLGDIQTISSDNGASRSRRSVDGHRGDRRRFRRRRGSPSGRRSRRRPNRYVSG